MDKNILIKYDIKGNFQERYFYNITFIYNKASNIITLENDPIDGDLFLKEIDGKSILMEYRGISRVDGMKIFVLNSSKIRREYKINEILK